MRQVIPFSKDIVFKTNIANITSISLEHEEKIMEGEVSGDFIIFGDYKIHNDTTEKELFKYRLPFTAIIPDDLERDSVVIDIDNFTYEQIENDVLKVNIDFSIEGELKKEEVLDMEDKRYEYQEVESDIEVLDEDDLNIIDTENEEEIDEEIDDFMETRFKEEMDRVEEVEMSEENEVAVVEDKPKEMFEKEDSRDELLVQSDEVKKQEETIVMEKENDKEINEYVTYHIHIIKEEETLDGIIKNYGSNMDVVKCYNDVSNIKVGDKVIIPEYIDE